MDSGFDSVRLMREIDACNQTGQPQVDWLIKWNPRTTDVAAVLAQRDADAATRWEHPREGKRVSTWEQAVHIEGIVRPLRRVLRLVERRIDRHGQVLIAPEIVLEGWTTSLAAAQFTPEAIIALYADHGTHEQFHSEFKSDLDLTRLPSGKFDTNLPGVPTGRAGDERVAPAGPARAAGSGWAGAPRGQAPAHQDGDAGADLPRGAADRVRQAPDSGAGGQRQSRQGLRAGAR